MDWFVWILTGPAQMVLELPWLGVGISVGALMTQALLDWRRGALSGRALMRKPLVFAGMLWLIYSLYEHQLHAVLQAPQNMLVRIDLLVLVPVLYALSAAGLLSLWRQVKGA